MPHTDRFKLPLAGTAAMVLASLPLAIPPANVAIFSQETSSSVGVRGASSNAQQFNLKSQGASTGLVAAGAAIRLAGGSGDGVSASSGKGGNGGNASAGMMGTGMVVGAGESAI